jgi:hypothetical protein
MAWHISSDEIKNPVTGKKGASAVVHSQAEADKRVREAKAAGVKLNVKKV